MGLSWAAKHHGLVIRQEKCVRPVVNVNAKNATRPTPPRSIVADDGSNSNWHRMSVRAAGVRSTEAAGAWDSPVTEKFDPLSLLGNDQGAVAGCRFRWIFDHPNRAFVGR